MTMTIGRVGTDGLTLRSPDADVGSISQDGDVLTVRGKIADPDGSLGLTPALARIQRAQILGLVNSDEMVIPFTDTENPHLDGFYVPLDSGVSDPEDPARQVFFPYTVKLGRVRGWQAPLFEKRCVGAERSGDPGVTEVGWCGVPAEAEATQFANGGSGSLATLTSEEGLVRFWYGAALKDEAVTFQLDPGDWHKSAARIEQSESGMWLSVVGRQVENLPTLVRVGNGIVRVTVGSTITVESYDTTSAWHSKTYKVVHDGVTATSMGTPANVTILRNSPEVCTIRLTYSVTNVTPYRTITLDLTVHLGSPIVNCVLTSTGTEDLGIFRTTTEAATSFTGGLAATSDDGDTNKFQIFCATAGVTKDVVNGGAYLSTAGLRFPFGLSNDRQRTSAENATYYWCAQRHRQRIVAR